ncbi:helix-turn-helix domain-containing protein [Flavobacterium sp. LAR06]|uniref:helix-turn-helix domain-containing protein n=1 Tax=Flavobacterium sp. LAR06 TaxID=3064897 RepID=UPI0035BF3281
MKEVVLSYGLDFDWIEPFVSQLEGVVDGNFIKLPESINTGTRYFIDCGEDAFALYIDVTYHEDLHFIQKNKKTDFICLTYDLTEEEVVNKGRDFIHNIGRLGYNMFVIDSSLSMDYYVKQGSRSFILCIFIKKSTISLFALKNDRFSQHIEKILDPTKNTFIKFDRMSNESYHILKDLRKLTIGDDIFDLQLKGASYLLVSDFIDQMLNNTIVIEKVDDADLSSIIETQHYLYDLSDSAFPSITFLARMANMSNTKFKSLFKKITGTTPNSFFMDNKLIRAKELIEENHSSISEVCDQLHFSNYSYFASRFKKYFGLTPRDFIKKM